MTSLQNISAQLWQKLLELPFTGQWKLVSGWQVYGLDQSHPPVSEFFITVHEFKDHDLLHDTFGFPEPYFLGIPITVFYLREQEKQLVRLKTGQGVLSDSGGQSIYPSLMSDPNENLCLGCRDDQPNQQAHMMPGGCLYSSSQEDD